MKGFKGFDKGLVCRGKQYKENTVFEEEAAEICKSGMHFCENPFDVLEYYDLVNTDGSFNEFAEVEALDKCLTDDNKKYCTKKLKIGAKLSFSGFVNACIEFVFEKTKIEQTDEEDETVIGSSGDSAQIGSSGDYAQIGSSGDYAQIGSSGYSAQIGSSGYSAQIGSSGDSAKIGSSGDYAKIGSSGYSAQIGSSGYSAKIGSSGYSAKIGSSGYSAQIGSSGDYTQIGSSGDSAKIGSSGDYTQIGSSGDYAKVTSEGEDSVICCAGHNSIVRAKKGSWITLSEWERSLEKDRWIPKCVKTKFVDGEIIKADTFYRLENGKFVEVKEDK
nr:MAG TPA: hypothetical protein [Caudoviricetes sp.]